MHSIFRNFLLVTYFEKRVCNIGREMLVYERIMSSGPRTVRFCRHDNDMKSNSKLKTIRDHFTISVILTSYLCNCKRLAVFISLFSWNQKLNKTVLFPEVTSC